MRKKSLCGRSTLGRITYLSILILQSMKTGSFFPLHRLLYCPVRCIFGALLLYGRKGWKVEDPNYSEFNQPFSDDICISSYHEFSISALGHWDDESHPTLFHFSRQLSFKLLTCIFVIIWQHGNTQTAATI